MKTNNKEGFILATLSYIAVTFLDLYFTYLGTPNLALEGNPLYNVIFFDWKGLIILNAITLIIYIAIAYYGFIGYKRPVTNETNLKKYLSFISFGDPNKYVSMMWKMPKYWAPQIACLCWSVAVILPFARFLIVILWFFLIMKIDDTLFYNIVAMVPMGRIDVVVAILGAWSLSFVWIAKEFKLNLKFIERRMKKEGKISD